MKKISLTLTLVLLSTSAFSLECSRLAPGVSCPIGAGTCSCNIMDNNGVDHYYIHVGTIKKNQHYQCHLSGTLNFGNFDSIKTSASGIETKCNNQACNENYHFPLTLDMTTKDMQPDSTDLVIDFTNRPSDMNWTAQFYCQKLNA